MVPAHPCMDASFWHSLSIMNVPYVSPIKLTAVRQRSSSQSTAKTMARSAAKRSRETACAGTGHEVSIDQGQQWNQFEACMV